MADNKKVEEIDISVLFNEETSEEAKTQIKTVFEAAVEARAAEMSALTEEKIEEMVAERLAAHVEELEEAADAYLSYVAEKWLEENEIAIESALKIDMAESLLDGLLGLVAEHNLEVPEGADDVVEQLVASNEDLTARLNEALKANMALEEAAELAEIEKAVERVSEGLSDTQVAKLKSLAEGIKFSDAADFAKKLAGVKASFFKESKEVADPTVDQTGPITEEKKEVAPAPDDLVEQITKRVTSRF